MSQPKPEIDYLINRRYADFRHGTGVQIKLFAVEIAQQPLHICWDVEQSVSDTYQPVCNLNTSRLRTWPFKRGRGIVNQAEMILGHTWHKQSRIANRLKEFSRTGSRNTRAYVIVASEEEAKISRQVLKIIDAEYVVNVMDYLHLGETDLLEFPEFATLLKEARKIFALTPPIQDVLAQISGRPDISILGVARESVNKLPRRLATDAKPLEIVMMGSVDYQRGLQELKKFCEGMDGAGIKYRLNYIGTQSMRDRLGSQLPVNYFGVRLAAERDTLLGSMHLAYLPGPDGKSSEDYLARFSFPSRTTDYFWHGLPVIGPLYDDSATVQMVAALRGNGVWFSQDASQLVGAVKNLTRNPQEWEAASAAVYEFAQKNFSIARTAEVIMEAFKH